MVDFFFHNLKNPLKRSMVDWAIVRNVLMYFDDAMKHLTLENVCSVLRKGGFLILGDVDQLRSQPELMEQLHLKFVQSWIYEKY